MSKLYYVPLEKLDERYTVSLDAMLKKEFVKNGIEYITVEGKTLSDKIVSGAFLDFAGTNYFKSSQIQKIASLFFEGTIKSGDVFFFADAWMPGIDALPYMSRLSKVDVKYAGMLYAGSWTPSDFVSQSLRDYAKYIERGWYEFFTELYFCSEFEKAEYNANLIGYDVFVGEKLIATRLPFDYDYVASFYKRIPQHRDKIVIFPHRFHWEKGADTFLQVAELIAEADNDVRFVITSGRSGAEPLADREEILLAYRALKRKLGDRLVYKSGLSKPDFYRELANARVVWSGALQENFGYSILECCTLGVTPVLPNRVVYPEFYDKKYLYNTLEESCRMVLQYLDNPEPVPAQDIKDKNGIENIVARLKNLLG